MNPNESVVAVYPSHPAAEAAIKELHRAGFDMKSLSIVGRDDHTDEHVVGYYNVLIAHGPRAETARAREILDYTRPETLEHHQLVHQSDEAK